MNQEEFLDLLRRFAERPMPALAGRHVYLWHGDVDPLRRALPGHTLRTLDLYALAASLSKAKMLDQFHRLLFEVAVTSSSERMRSY